MSLSTFTPVPLHTVADVIDPHPSHRAPGRVNQGIPFVGIGDLSKNIDASFPNARIVSRSIFAEHAARYDLQEGLLGLGRVASVGLVVDLPIPDLESPYVVSPTLAIIKAKSIDKAYLKFQLMSPQVQLQLDGLKQGSGRESVGVQKLRNILIHVPSFDEQRRIVETLDDHLSRLDKALAELERSSRLTNNFKDSLIHGIVSGQYSDNLSTWQVTTLGQVAKWSSGGTPQSGNPNYYGGQIPWCVIGDLTESLVTETAKTITDEGLAASSAKIVNPGTVLLAMYGASIGRTGIAGTPMATNQAIACAVPNANLDPNYLLLYLQSQKRMFIESGKGGAQPNISQTIIKAWALNLPPIEEQKRLLGLAESHQATIKSLSEVSLKLEDQYLTLKRSLLNAAFTGGLVA